MPKQRKWTKEQLVAAVKTSKSFAQVLKKLNLKGGGAHSGIKKIINDLGLDTTHFSGQLWSKGNTALDDSRIGKKDTSRIFVEESEVSPAYVRKLIIKHNLLPYRCKCGIENEWQGTNISLQLDHIDGNRRNHQLDNLRFLCPNCHSQTPTFCGKNKSSSKQVSDDELKNAIINSPNIRQALLSVGLENGRNYKRAKKLKQSIQ
jgi:Zn finger protein HypA/HybF involved in hydrogenase expression